MAKTMRILIGYASRFGSTRDIAIRIADTLRARGNLVDVRPVDAHELADIWCGNDRVRADRVGS